MKQLRPTTIALFVLCLFTSITTVAQTTSFRVLLRTMKTNIPSKQSTKACVIVQDNGQYRYEELPSFQKATPQNSKVFIGYLSPELRKQLDTLVDKKDLISLGNVRPAHWAVQAHYDMELVSLRLRRGGASEQELNYFVADGKGAIPPSVEAFTPWMASLRRSVGAPLSNAQPDTGKVANDTAAGR